MAERMATLGLPTPIVCASSIEFYDIDLVVQRRRDVDRGIGDQEWPWIGRYIHEKDVTQAPLGPQASASG